MTARGLSESCTFCGHPPHPDLCTRQIVTAIDKKPVPIPCPCAWRNEENR